MQTFLLLLLEILYEFDVRFHTKALKPNLLSVAYDLGETQTCNYFFLRFGRDSPEILESVWQEEKSFEVLKRCYIQINHKNYNFLACDWFKNVLFSTNSLRSMA